MVHPAGLPPANSPFEAEDDNNFTTDAEIVGHLGFAPSSRRLRAGTSLSKFATHRDAKADPASREIKAQKGFEQEQTEETEKECFDFKTKSSVTSVSSCSTDRPTRSKLKSGRKLSPPPALLLPLWRP